MNKMTLTKLLEKQTGEELRTSLFLTKSEFKSLLKEHGLKVLYEYRTPISNTLIPVDSELNKYFKSGKRAKSYNKIHKQCNDTNWIETETKTRNEIKREHEQQLGYILAELSILNESINKQLKHISYQKFIIDVINKLGNEDYIGIIAEEQYGKYDVPEHFTENLLTDEMIVSFVGNKYGLEKATQISEILRKG